MTEPPPISRTGGPAAVLSVTVCSVSKSFGSLLALKNISFEIKQAAGKIISIWGENGAGKSTLLSLLGGLSRPTRGAIEYLFAPASDSEAPVCAAAHSPVFRLRVRPGFLLQQPMLYADLTAAENLELFCSLASAGAEQLQQLINRFELEPVLGRRLRECSPGMIKRVSVARALLHDPQLVLLDEPFSSLDWEAQDKITELLCELRSSGRTVFLATHQFDAVQRLADRVLVVKAGEVIRDIQIDAAARGQLSIGDLSGSAQLTPELHGGKNEVYSREAQ